MRDRLPFMLDSLILAVDNGLSFDGIVSMPEIGLEDFGRRPGLAGRLDGGVELLRTTRTAVSRLVTRFFSRAIAPPQAPPINTLPRCPSPVDSKLDNTDAPSQGSQSPLINEYHAQLKKLSSQVERLKQLDADKGEELATASEELKQLQRELDTSSSQITNLQRGCEIQLAELNSLRTVDAQVLALELEKSKKENEELRRHIRDISREPSPIVKRSSPVDSESDASDQNADGVHPTFRDSPPRASQDLPALQPSNEEREPRKRDQESQSGKGRAEKRDPRKRAEEGQSRKSGEEKDPRKRDQGPSS